ncbi:DUF4397 domain-containing protein [Vallitalea pronyensis]|uniref:DUF4397 domain-containing protein n=1 Tax=Vallitalea pronyensis TaxID=1348613 RepID=A0A8J8MMX8_9FIRM|nr:DUF4397 domain-containing protein [Vallitalea pronyensis]QUI24424.1 DUF4397 domain-containing protein [Vallitalea pronyensis]
MYDKPTSYIRLLHASPKAPPVDIYSDEDNILADELSYGEFTPYLPITPGSHLIEVYLADDANDALISEEVMIPEKYIATFAVIGEAPNVELYEIEDPIEPLRSDESKLRFVNLSPNSTPLDVVAEEGTTLFNTVPYKGVSSYRVLSPKTYTVNLKPSGSDEAILYVPNIRLRPDAFYSLYAIGLVGENEPYIQLLIPLDGNTYIET